MTNAFLFADNASTTLAAPVGPSALSLTLAAGTGTKFPSPGAGQTFALTLNDAATRAVYEVCYCTARSGDVLTITRAQEGTAATTWQIGDFAFNGPTSGQMAQMVQQPNMVDASISPVFGPTRVEGTATVDGIVACIDPNAHGGVAITGTANGAAIELRGNGSTTPNKLLRAINGLFDIVNSAETAEIFTLTDLGDITNIRSVTLPNQLAGGLLLGRDTFGVARPFLTYGGDNFIDHYGGLAGLRWLRGSDGALLMTLDTGGDLSTVGSMSAPFISSSGGVSAGGTFLGNAVSVTASVQGNFFNSTGNMNAAGTVSAANIAATGNVTGGFISSSGNVNAGGTFSGAAVNVSGGVAGKTLATTGGNVQANSGYLRASFGFFNNPSDVFLAPVLNDFIVNTGNPGSFQIPARGTTQGFIFQYGRSATSGYQTSIFFPKVFPSACIGILTCEGVGHGWNGGSNATLHAPDTVGATNGFVDNCLRWNGSSFVAGLNETVNWLAWGV